MHEDIDVFKIHHIIKNITINQIGQTHIHRSNLFDSIAATLGIIDCIDG